MDRDQQSILSAANALFTLQDESLRHFNVARVAYFMAAKDSADFFIQHFPTALTFATHVALIDHCLNSCSVEGTICEFGVAGGATLKFIAQRTPGLVHGFDSFLGIPETWSHFQRQGRCSCDGKAPDGLPTNVVIHSGWFDETLTEFSEIEQPLRFIHIDSDLYSSAKIIFDRLGKSIVPGSVILFDEYFNYPNWEQHEHKAWREFVQDNDVEFEYIGWVPRSCAVAVKVTAVGTPKAGRFRRFRAMRSVPTTDGFALRPEA